MMNTSNWDKVFKAIIAFAVLLASFAVSYYFFIFLPQKEKTRIEMQQAERQAKELELKKEQDAATSKAAENETLRTNCLAQALSALNADKAAFCRDASATLTLQYLQAECGTPNAIDKNLCLFISGEIEGKNENCELGGSRGDEINKRYGNAVATCNRSF